MIFLTGDIHGEIDIHKLNTKNWKIGQTLTKDDYLIILGDFGLVWDNSKSDQWWLNWLNKQPWTTLFVDGNHENFKLLNKYPIKKWKKGKIHQIHDSIFHLMRGQVFEIENKTFFTFGGAFSHDIYRRKLNVSWWKEELPTKKECDEGLDNLELYKNKIDFILTHTPPNFVSKELGLINNINITNTYGSKYMNIEQYLNIVKDTVDFKDWYCGHLHVNKTISKKFHVLYDDIIQI